jgi:hypothetical protein
LFLGSQDSFLWPCLYHARHMIDSDCPLPTCHILGAILTPHMTRRLGHEKSFVKAPTTTLLQIPSWTSPRACLYHAWYSPCFSKPQLKGRHPLTSCKFVSTTFS